MNRLFRPFRQSGVKNPSLLVAWNEDASGISAGVTDYLDRKLGCQSLGEIEPTEFFPLGGVAIEGNLVRFPESRFCLYSNSDLIVLKSDPPGHEWHTFLQLVLDIAQDQFQVREVYTVGGMVSLTAHTAPRQLLAVFNSPEMKQALGRYDLATELDYQTPPGQRPTLSSFLLWAAKRRKLPGANLWVPVPFYLLAAGDPGAEKKALSFLDQRFGLKMDLSDLDEEIVGQNAAIAALRARSPEIDQLIARLENSQGLSPEESEKLVNGVTASLNGGENQSPG